MGPLVISAVDHTTGRLTVTAHGRANGDGPGGIYSPDGAVPGGSSATADYWLIVVDANTVKLADSQAHALAGTAITLSDNGSGDLYLLIGLPFRRATTYVPNSGPLGSPTPGSQLKSADLNSMQDAFEALWKWFAGQTQSVWKRGPRTPTIPFTPGGDWQLVSGSLPSWRAAGTLPCVNVPASSTVYYPLRVNLEDRIKSIIVWGRAFVGACTLSLYDSGGIGGGTESLGVMTLVGGGTTLSVPADGLYNPRTLTLQTPTQLTAGEMLFLRVDVPGGDNMDLMTYGVVADAP